MINAEAVLVSLLAEFDEITDVVGDRIATESPEDLTQPWIRVSVLDERSQLPEAADVMVAVPIQIDCFSGQGAATTVASNLSLALRGKLDALNGANYAVDNVLVTNVNVGRRRIPDGDMRIPRYAVTGTITLRPWPVSN